MNKAKSNATQRAYMVKRRAAARAAGMCAVCCTRKPEGGFKNCVACRTGSRKSTPPALPFCLECLTFHVVGAHVMQWRLLRRAA